jgi:hypothetical protein
MLCDKRGSCVLCGLRHEQRSQQLDRPADGDCKFGAVLICVISDVLGYVQIIFGVWAQLGRWHCGLWSVIVTVQFMMGSSMVRPPAFSVHP